MIYYLSTIILYIYIPITNKFRFKSPLCIFFIKPVFVGVILQNMTTLQTSYCSFYRPIFHRTCVCFTLVIRLLPPLGQTNSVTVVFKVLLRFYLTKYCKQLFVSLFNNFKTYIRVQNQNKYISGYFFLKYFGIFTANGVSKNTSHDFYHLCINVGKTNSHK